MAQHNGPLETQIVKYLQHNQHCLYAHGLFPAQKLRFKTHVGQQWTGWYHSNNVAPRYIFQLCHIVKVTL